jgi:hypothetical protein
MAQQEERVLARREFEQPADAISFHFKPEPEPVDDLDWLIFNIVELRHQYAGQWIAIAQGRVVASTSTVPELKEVIETTGVERPLVTFINGQEPNWNMAYGSQDL